MKKVLLLVAIAAMATASGAQAQTVLIYDATSDLTTGTTTGSVPHTYTGQAFSVSNGGGSSPQVTGIRVFEFVIGAQTIPFSQARIQIWGTFDPTATGTTQVFSNAIGAPLVFNTGPITTTGNAIIVQNFTLPTPITLPQTTNLGIAFNFQSSPDGITFNDDTNLVTGMRAPVNTMPIPVGQNVTVGGQYYRNASNEVNFNFNASSARSIGGTNPNDGLAFQLISPVPEPTSLALVGLVGVAGIGWRRWRKKQ
jgi:hypothetical protein